MPTITTTPLTYSGYVQAVATMAVIPTTTDSNGFITTASAEFNALIPQMLNYAELRIQRDLDLFALQTNNEIYTLSAGNNILSLSLSFFVTVQTIRYINGTKKIALVPVSKEFLQAVYDDTSVTGPPKYFAPYGGDAATSGDTSINFMIGPTPDQNYALSIVGTQRAQSLYSFAGYSPAAYTATTFISQWLPDLLVMASMIFVSGYQRNFSATSDDPQMPVNYEKQYQALLKGAMVEEARKRFAASGWTAQSPTPVASADRK